MTEKELVNEYVDAISHAWHVRREVEGLSITTGETRRIDLIIMSKEIVNGRRPMFGIECKRPKLDSMNNYTKWIKQATDYTNCLWGDNKVQLPILICPSWNYWDDMSAEGISQHYFVTRLLGQFGIGELLCDEVTVDGEVKKNYCIQFSGSKFWSTAYGFNAAMAKMNFEKQLRR